MDSHATRPGGRHCRFCEAPLELTMVDLGKSPLCESFLPADRLEEMEPFYPLHVRVCTRCWLAQLPSFVPPEEIFEEYAYFSAYSASWVEHAHAYVEMISDRLGLGPESLVVELASNDGYLLQHFLPKRRAGARYRPGGERRGRGGGAGRADLVEFFGVELAERLVARARPRRPRARQQRARAGAGPERLRPRRRDPPGAPAARRLSSSRTSHGCSKASSTTRSTTSTSRYFSLDDGPGSSRRTG